MYSGSRTIRFYLARTTAPVKATTHTTWSWSTWHPKTQVSTLSLHQTERNPPPPVQRSTFSLVGLSHCCSSLDFLIIYRKQTSLYCISHSQCVTWQLLTHFPFVSTTGDSRPTSPGGSFLPHAPRFKVKLKDTELLEGATVRFEIIVRGLPIPSINMWVNDCQRITSAD